MRVGDLSVEVVPLEGGVVREERDGTVLARGGQVYALRFTNHAPLRAVVEVRLDGTSVSAGGLVLPAQQSVTLERPMQAHECGRFTVIAEGSEAVFGPDGGRSNPDLGLIEVRYRRELPREIPTPPLAYPGIPGRPRPLWDHPWLIGNGSPPSVLRGVVRSADVHEGSVRYQADAMATPAHAIYQMAPSAATPAAMPTAMPTASVAPVIERAAIERAAGTGLTGHSAQTFRDVVMGTLEAEETVLRLRLVIGTASALEAPRPLPVAHPCAGPTRPEARP